MSIFEIRVQLRWISPCTRDSPQYRSLLTSPRVPVLLFIGPVLLPVLRTHLQEGVTPSTLASHTLYLYYSYTICLISLVFKLFSLFSKTEILNKINEYSLAEYWGWRLKNSESVTHLLKIYQFPESFKNAWVLHTAVFKKYNIPQLNKAFLHAKKSDLDLSLLLVAGYTSDRFLCPCQLPVKLLAL